MPSQAVVLRDGRVFVVGVMVDTAEYAVKLREHGLLPDEAEVAMRMLCFESALIEEYLMCPKVPAKEFSREEKSLLVGAILSRVLAPGGESASGEGYEAIVEEYRRRKAGSVR
ncbi:MAG: hypothetical protein HYU39_04650 [Thaumarchaeota archaeon]|nr:hypothetical protein [Nitrososphaerota archaeon]